MLKFFVLNLLFFSSFFTFAESTFENHFKSGSQLYQERKYEEAKLEFLKSLEEQPNNVSVLYNLALSELKLDKKGAALGYLRRALKWSPTSQDIRQLILQIQQGLPVQQIPHELNFFENLKGNFLVYISLHTLFFVNLLFFVGAGIGLVRFSQFSWVSGLMLVGFCVTLFLGGLKIQDLMASKATVLSPALSVKTAPGNDEAQVLELYEGLQVYVLNTKDGWSQVYYPGTHAGWVETKALMEH